MIAPTTAMMLREVPEHPQAKSAVHWMDVAADYCYNMDDAAGRIARRRLEELGVITMMGRFMADTLATMKAAGLDRVPMNLPYEPGLNDEPRYPHLPTHECPGAD